MQGCENIFYLSSCLVPKNASTQITYIADVVQKTVDDLKIRERVLPRILRVASDNATAETKNQVVLKFLSWLVFLNVFCAAELAQLRAGHTHNSQYREFSRLATLIARFVHPLEDINDVKNLISEKLKVAHGFLHHHKAVLLTGAYDWASWLSTLDCNVQGHTATHQNKVTGKTEVHSFRLVKRKDFEGIFSTKRYQQLHLRLFKQHGHTCKQMTMILFCAQRLMSVH